MDISTITDIKELKALAFDAIQRIEIEQRNLQLIQQRLVELQRTEDKEE